MDTQNITGFVDELEALQEEGVDRIPTKLLIEHLKLITESSEVCSENLRIDWKMRHEINLEAYRAESEGQGRMLDATVALAGMALKSAILINGGAAVAMLAYLGNIASKQLDAGAVPGALRYFVWGVLVAAIGTGVGYICQACFAEGHPKWGFWLRIVSAFLIIGSYVFFGLGGGEAYNSFTP